MTILVAPDKFKGSLSSFEACDAMAAGIRSACKDAQVHLFPMADGGDGFAAVMKHYLHTETIACNTVDPLGRAIEASYEWQAANKTAIIELAAASGLVLLSPNQYNVMEASTFGTGLLVADALAKGATHIILGLGGSATNDAGTGILEALGFEFLDTDQNHLPPCGATLGKVHQIIAPAKLPAAQITLACDVQNPLYGPNGAAHVYAAQKGASIADIELLDEGLRHYAGLLFSLSHQHIAHIPGTGAAGGIAASVMPWFQTIIRSGASLVLEASGIELAMPKADLLITGEGKLDAQSLQGKLISRLVIQAKENNLPVTAICGQLMLNDEDWRNAGLQFAVSICPKNESAEWCMLNAAILLQQKTAELMNNWHM